MRGRSYDESDSRHQRCGKLDHVATDGVRSDGWPRGNLPDRTDLPRSGRGAGFRRPLQRHATGRILGRGELGDGAPAAVYDGPYWVARWTARMPAAKRPSESRDAPRDRYGDFEVKREWSTGDAVPEVQVVRHEITGMPHVEVIGLSKEKVEQTLLDTVVEIRERLEGIKLSPRQRP